jgi:hypothetical protein
VPYITFVETPAITCRKITAQILNQQITVSGPFLPGLLELDDPLTDVPVGVDQDHVHLPCGESPGVLQQRPYPVDQLCIIPHVG